MKALFLTLLLSTSAAAQTAATVHFYRSKETSGVYPKTKTGIFVEGVKVANLGNNRVFAIDLPAGKYIFAARDKKEPGIGVTVEAGKSYYIRGDMDLTRIRLFRKPNFRLVLVPSEQAIAELNGITPIPKDDIKDQRVRAVAP